MSDHPSIRPETKRFDLAVQIRNFEIELFWKRSLFFWGFIASAFVGYAALRKSSPELGILIACFGMVCSLAWTLLNRGSKYWQENWETKVERLEPEVTGKLFAEEEAIQFHKGWWLRARTYSVSKLVIALSDYVFLLWFVLVIAELLRKYAPAYGESLRTYGLALFVTFSIIYTILLMVFGRKSVRP
ncbi:MAG: hypothetical protein A4E19_12225 [Nitrospira sp. SG-bin1]|nr:MAG: hypothetical protein A4E19_12225 [Nitrospira sp. SG-bin1]